MLEHLLKMISLESLLFSFKERDLFQEFNIHQEALALRQAKISKISDSDILKSILPKDLSSKMFGSGNLNLLAFIFALRHKILLLNCLFHLSALKQKNSYLFQETKNDFSLLFGDHFFEYYTLFFKMLIPQFWGKSKQLPILGFSAVGCHFGMREVTYCRAFDAYNLPYCLNITQDVFCEEHSIENFWKQKIVEESSVQAKLSQFYSNPINFSEFDEESLRKLVENFFRYFERSQNNLFILPIDEEKLKFLLGFYSFSSIEDLKKEGGMELRRRFIEMAKHFHPDAGGSHELFREATENYEFLREILIK